MSKWVSTKKLRAKHKPKTKRYIGYNMLRKLGAFGKRKKKGAKRRGRY